MNKPAAFEAISTELPPLDPAIGDAVRARWQAAIAAGVDLIATDQYEELATLLSRPR